MSKKQLFLVIIFPLILSKITTELNVNSKSLKSKLLLKRQLFNNNNHDWSPTFTDDSGKPRIIGIRVEDTKGSSVGDNLETLIPAYKQIPIRVFGLNLNQSDVELGLTDVPGTKGDSCRPKIFDIKLTPVDDFTSTATIEIRDSDTYYLCITFPDSEFEIIRKSGLGKRELAKQYLHIGDSDETWLTFTGYEELFPIWLNVIFICILLVTSGLFSGLNLGLMSLDKNELQVIERCGTEQEKQYARAITPVRQRGNYLLCTLLLGNVFVNSMLTILLDSLSDGMIAVVGSTISIVIFGEIIPQALCSRHGLAVGARTVWLTYIFMVITFPLSFPISLMLDKILGEEIGNVYDRERLMEYIRVTKDYNRLEADEVNIISGALKLKNIKVVEIMTPINDVYMLPYNAILNFETINDINKNGYSRIPIYENEKNNVVGILHTRDVMLTDPDNNMPLKAIIEFYKHPLYFVYEDVTLDVMLNEFKQGKSHMAFVRRINDDGINDPVYELAGVVTLEDVIEELIQAEINDETDVISDNRRKQKRKEVLTRPNFSDFVRLSEGESHKAISSQLALAAFNYLSTFVEPFSPQYLSGNVLKRLMSKQIYNEIKTETAQFDADITITNENKLYTYGKPADYFILILEGRVKVIIGKENHQYEGGPFAFFGVSALKLSANDNDRVSKSTSLGRLSICDGITPSLATQDIVKSSPPPPSGHRKSVVDGPMSSRDNAFIPDFTVFCLENTTYMKVTRFMYLTAIRATIMERQRDSNASVNPDEEAFHLELDSIQDNHTLRSNSSSTNLLPERGRSRSELQSTSSTSKLQSIGGGSDRLSPTISSRASITSPESSLPKYEDLSISINTNNLNNQNNSNESINKRNSSPADEKSHLI